MVKERTKQQNVPLSSAAYKEAQMLLLSVLCFRSNCYLNKKRNAVILLTLVGPEPARYKLRGKVV